MPGLSRVEGPALVLVSAEPLAGKTTTAAGLAQRLQAQGRSVALLRLAGDDHAATDAQLFGSLAFNSQPLRQPMEAAAALDAGKGADVAIIEAPAGDPVAVLSSLASARALVVASGASSPEDVAAYCRAVGDPLAGVVLTRVPLRRRDDMATAFQSAGLPLLALLPEDRTLAAPTLGEVAEALQARTSFLNANRSRLLDRLLIASISADPGQGYFARYQPSAVIVRGDKPDLQLAALNAGAPCLIITGGLPTLSYVLDRAEEEELPLLQTELDTVATVQRIEAMFAATPFAGEAKLRRVAELLGDLDTSALLETK